MRHILQQMITLKALVGHLVVPDVLKQRKRWINNQELRKEWFSSSTNQGIRFGLLHGNIFSQKNTSTWSFSVYGDTEISSFELGFVFGSSCK